jgi:hypothetical protein
MTRATIFLKTCCSLGGRPGKFSSQASNPKRFYRRNGFFLIANFNHCGDNTKLFADRSFGPQRCNQRTCLRIKMMQDHICKQSQNQITFYSQMNDISIFWLL